MENLRGRGSAEAHHEEEADREPDAAAGGSVRHVIVGLWLILVRMSASVHASESKPTSETISGNPDREASFAIGIRHLRHRPDPYAVSARARRGTRNCYISLFSYVCGPPLALTRRRPLRGSSLRRLARAAGAQRERVCQRTTIGELASERNRRDGPPPSVGATQTSDAADEGRWMA